jgi:hypothetical protein
MSDLVRLALALAQQAAVRHSRQVAARVVREHKGSALTAALVAGMAAGMSQK